jgi:hypothetical protein
VSRGEGAGLIPTTAKSEVFLVILIPMGQYSLTGLEGKLLADKV